MPQWKFFIHDDKESYTITNPEEAEKLRKQLMDSWSDVLVITVDDQKLNDITQPICIVQEEQVEGDRTFDKIVQSMSDALVSMQGEMIKKVKDFDAIPEFVTNIPLFLSTLEYMIKERSMKMERMKQNSDLMTIGMSIWGDDDLLIKLDCTTARRFLVYAFKYENDVITEQIVNDCIQDGRGSNEDELETVFALPEEYTARLAEAYLLFFQKLIETGERSYKEAVRRAFKNAAAYREVVDVIVRIESEGSQSIIKSFPVKTIDPDQLMKVRLEVFNELTREIFPEA